MFAAVLAVLVLAAATPAAAIDFHVTSLADAAVDHDINPGDGLCVTNRAGTCSLRAAIEESNARTGQDRILFDVAGTVVLSTEGGLPAITDPLVILGSSAPGYNNSATRIGDAPPQVFIDGVLLGGATPGLLVAGTSFASIDAIGIVNMPGSGMSISTTASGVLVDNSWIGIAADGTNAGNGGAGIYLGGDGNFIGAQAAVGELGGLGNLISDNGSHGINIDVGANNNRVRLNFIGFNATALSTRPNAGYGINDGGTGNRIGELNNGNIKNGPYIAGNALGGINLFGANTRVEAAILGINRNGSFVTNPADGIRVAGSGHTIGGASELQGNIIANHVRAIRIGGGVPGHNAVVRFNRIGSITFSQGTSSHAILVENGSNVQVLDNTVLNAGQDGIRIFTDLATVNRNNVGWSPGIFGPQDHGAGEIGIRIQGNDAVVRDNVIGFGGRSPSGFDDGMVVRGSDNVVVGNFVGVTPEGAAMGNRGAGIRVGSTTETSANNSVSFNTVRNNQAFGGIVLYGDPTCVGNVVALNVIADNPMPAVNLVGSFGRDVNDVGDPDEDVNRLLNSPQIVATSVDTSVVPPVVSVTYKVDSNSSAATYPLLVDFYLGRPFRDDMVEYLATDTYTLASARLEKTFQFPMPAGRYGGWLVAQGHDADNNSSESAMAVAFGETDALFRDGFEG